MSRSTDRLSGAQEWRFFLWEPACGATAPVRSLRADHHLKQVTPEQKTLLAPSESNSLHSFLEGWCGSASARPHPSPQFQRGLSVDDPSHLAVLRVDDSTNLAVQSVAEDYSLHSHSLLPATSMSLSLLPAASEHQSLCQAESEGQCPLLAQAGAAAL
ncbi:hypothetical protein GOODEAATRI_034567 [Goodea atripinnis]|uniref:Uncharacterized protein n=1 Tax=Goodea atripinnis TaxID=208336 RepID=A0ABV0PJJ7_9TELE